MKPHTNTNKAKQEMHIFVALIHHTNARHTTRTVHEEEDEISRKDFFGRKPPSIEALSLLMRMRHVTQASLL